MATHITPNLFHFLQKSLGNGAGDHPQLPKSISCAKQQGWTTAFYQHFCKIQLSCPLKEKNTNNYFHFRLEKERKERPTRKSLQSNSESCFYVSGWLSSHQIWYFWPSYAWKAGAGMRQYFAVWWHVGRCETWVLIRRLSSRGLKDTSWWAVGWVLLPGVGGISDLASLESTAVSVVITAQQPPGSSTSTEAASGSWEAWDFPCPVQLVPGAAVALGF